MVECGLTWRPVAHLDHERAQPDPYPGDGSVEGQQDSDGYRAGGDRGERDEEECSADGAINRPTRAALRAETVSGDEAGGNQRVEADSAKDEMQHAGAGHGRARGCARRKPCARIGDEDSGADEAETVDREKDRQPRAASAWMKRAASADCASDDEQPAAQEIGDLDPAEVTVAQETQGMPANVESLSGQDLRDSDRNIHEPGCGAAGQERTRRGARRGRARHVGTADIRHRG